MKIVNAEGKVLGRLASEVAQYARDGEDVRVVNSEEAVISGDEQEVKEEYEQKYERGRRDRGPYFPKRADKILKRTVRNMLPDGSDGRDTRSKVRTYLGVPDQMEDEVEEVDVKSGDELKHRNYVKLGEVSEFIGGDH
ncbi:MAG: 50S ribosomal protein L13 [Candidatus Nanohalobium sp.]